MSLKLEKIAAEREKARIKRDEWEERRKEWNRKYHEQENSEICADVSLAWKRRIACWRAYFTFR